VLSNYTLYLWARLCSRFADPVLSPDPDLLLRNLLFLCRRLLWMNGNTNDFYNLYRPLISFIVLCEQRINICKICENDLYRTISVTDPEPDLDDLNTRQYFRDPIGGLNPNLPDPDQKQKTINKFFSKISVLGVT
jgi:hypothetical protein